MAKLQNSGKKNDSSPKEKIVWWLDLFFPTGFLHFAFF